MKYFNHSLEIKVFNAAKQTLNYENGIGIKRNDLANNHGYSR